jgi:hypothetical protein
MPALSRTSLPTRPRRLLRFIDPIDALTEILFGLVMVATFTFGAALIVEDGPMVTFELAAAITGCNLAWGVIDAALYLLGCFLERSRKVRLRDAIVRAESPAEALVVIGRHLDPILAPLSSEEERKHLYEAIRGRLEGAAPAFTGITLRDVRGALMIFVLTLACVLPAVVPLLLIPDRFIALRVSNALVLLTLIGVCIRWARTTHVRPWLFGGSLFALGIVLIAVAIALGG